ncbi:hypothetical protein DEO72_LG6g280 [Vigna unguiculata]|uniref:Uncharacterized protein n=1 Tax=Vigna unguiculata TaxID=3917 RepID=A0A4D6M5Y9_VIGUN|nr:hypothetical protein DEO72_LG6g280 [Vigna unguiculata]
MRTIRNKYYENKDEKGISNVEFEILLTQPHILDSLVELSNGLDNQDGSGRFDDQDGSGGPDDQDGPSGPDDPTRSGGLNNAHESGRTDDLDVRADSMTPNDLGMHDPNDLGMPDRPKDLARSGQPNDTN